MINTDIYENDNIRKNLRYCIRVHGMKKIASILNKKDSEIIELLYSNDKLENLSVKDVQLIMFYTFDNSMIELIHNQQTDRFMDLYGGKEIWYI